MQHPRASPFGGGIAGFLAQLALRAGKARLARIKLARRKLDDGLADGIAKLPFHHQMHVACPIIQQGHDHHGAGVYDVFAGGDRAIGQLHPVAADFEEMTLDEGLAVKTALDQLSVRHFNAP